MLFQPPTPPAALPSARVIVSPATPTVAAQDTLRLSARVVDQQGNPVPGARVRFVGGNFEGSVDTTGLFTSAATGTVPIAAVAILPNQSPVVERFQVNMVPGPATRVAFASSDQRAADARAVAVARTLVTGQSLTLTATSYSAQNDRRNDPVAFRSTNPAIAQVSAQGVVTAIAPGRTTIVARAGSAEATMPVTVVANTIASLEVTPASGRVRTGDVVRFTVVARDAAGRTVRGLTPSWSFSPGQGMIDPDGGDGVFVGYEARPYTVTATLGGRSAQTTVTLAHRDVRRPATVVGRLPRTRFTTEEIWIHPDGKHAYLGSGSGGDVLYTIDISDPSKPTVTDSIIANTRRVNDVMTTADGRTLVFTREGASDRKNGIVICSTADPAHPRPIAEFTDGVTGGVHSAFIYTDPKYGTNVFLTNDGTNALHVVNIDDPAHPKQMAVFNGVSAYGGGSLHDIDVQNGLLYASWWNDGLVILDVGNGIKGGSPSNPVVVSQFKYDLNDLYRQVEASGGPGFIRGTHTAWRHKNYVFIADEVFPASGVKGAKDAAVGRAYGRLQVVDVRDLEHPRSVAYYEPEYGGVHNVWVAGDTLYMGAYNAGFRAFDISGELRGDLRAQEREMVHVQTADLDGRVRNAAMTWGVVVRDGLAYVNDMYNGLWIVRMEPRRGDKVVQ